MMRRRSGRCSGLSLLDAMATLTLVAIAGTIAAPVLRDIVETSRLRAAAWTLASDLHRTRARAIRESRPHRLTLSTTDLDGGTGSPVAYAIGPSDGSGPDEHRHLAADVRCANTPGSWIEFDPRGLAHGESMELEIRGAGSSSARLRVRSTGRVDFPG